jgi:hypothetical protein
LVYSGYSGTINFTKTEANNWENLSTLDLSGSKLGLSLKEVPVTTVKIENVKSASNLSIVACSKLKDLSYNGSTFKTLNLDIPLVENPSVISFAPNISVSSTGSVSNKTNDNMVYFEEGAINCTTNDGIIYITN